MKYNRKSKWKVALILILTFLLTSCAIDLSSENGVKAENSALKCILANYTSDEVTEDKTDLFVGYVKDATINTFDVYTEKGGTYIISLPMSLFDDFPASDHWNPGWMNIDVYCGNIDDFTWAVVCTGPSLGSGNANVCTSADGGSTWWVGDKFAMYPGTVTGAGFASSKVGFMSYRYFTDQGPEISRTLDGGKTWERMMVDIPDYINEYCFTPLSPTFTGEHGRYPIELYSDANFISVIYLMTEDGGLTWQWVKQG